MRVSDKVREREGDLVNVWSIFARRTSRADDHLSPYSPSQEQR